ncbi:GNAT family N-acetyltransferase [Acinetobacter haemolyticus]|uniref:GNAT family N-acetyltransferase n=1 Tax=Acinetobacter haemolyticus TaxID=29430 RepID=UPI001372D4E8|nr:GNAT family N-acetyltransferase [Acinetobacter haemolyticus]NAS00749.1 GNAT family N-acetyltransferase [Acinetobacter haemolyticus]
MNKLILQKDELNEIYRLIKKFMMMRLRLPARLFEVSDPRNKFSHDLIMVRAVGSSGEDDLYLRFGCYAYTPEKDVKTIVVARIGFKRIKNGAGTALLKELCHLGEKYDYQYLAIECPNSQCKTFMNKLGFSNEFIVPIQKLKLLIQDYESKKLISVNLDKI